MGFSTSNNPNRSLVVRTASRPFTGVSSPALWRAAARCGRRWSARPFTGVSAPAVLGPAFTPGSNADGPLLLSGPFTGLLSRAARPSRGFTLVEMLVVVTIMVLLMGFAATRILPATQSRRSREAARALNVYLSSARNRAMETGRPCGIILHHFGNLACSMTIDQCEVPPPYCGESESAMAALTISGGVLTATLDIAPAGGMVKPGDLIQFNSQGPYYRITNAADYPTAPATPEFVTSQTLQLAVADASQNPLAPWPTFPTVSSPVTYRILRSPAKGVAAPLQLPAAAVIDLGVSSTNATGSFNANDVTILFSPNGSVESVRVNATTVVITDPIFLLVGKRERVTNAFVASPTPANRSLWPNYQDLDNIWVTINPLSGVISTHQVASSTSAPDAASAIAASRSLATDAQAMGGK